MDKGVVVLRYKNIEGSESKSRHSIADAIDVLTKVNAFSKRGTATVRVSPFRWPTKEVVYFCCVEMPGPEDSAVLRVFLATALEIWGRPKRGTDEFAIDPMELEGSIVDCEGNVTMTSGREARAVRVVPLHWTEDVTETQRRIIMGLVKSAPNRDQYFRSLRSELPPEYRETVPDYEFLNFAKFHELKVPLLKEAIFQIRTADPSLDVSDQAISNTLRSFGLRARATRSKRASA